VADGGAAAELAFDRSEDAALLAVASFPSAAAFYQQQQLETEAVA
jgi:hypothetical protein